MAMNEDLLNSLPRLDDFVTDPDLDSLYRQAVVVAKEFGWPVPERAEFEAGYKKERAGKVQQ